MEGLVEHLVKPLVSNPDAVSVNAIDGESVTVLELSVDAADRAIVEDEATMRAVRNVVSAAAGSKKATVELVGDGEANAEE